MTGLVVEGRCMLRESYYEKQRGTVCNYPVSGGGPGDLGTEMWEKLRRANRLCNSESVRFLGRLRSGAYC